MSETLQILDGKKTVMPSKNWLVGHASLLINDPLQIFEEARDQFYGVARMRMFHVPSFMLSEPEAIQHILLGNHDNYDKQTRIYDKLRLFLGNGLVTSEGDFWKRQRRIMQPPFMKKSLESFISIIDAYSNQISERWNQKTSSQATEINLSHEMMELTLRIAAKSFFGYNVSKKGDQLGEAVDIVLERFNYLSSAPYPFPEYLPTPANYTFWKKIKFMDRLVSEIIQKRRTSDKEELDLLALLMHAKDEETGESMTDKQLRDEVLTMLLAGHETTANALVWTFYLLAKNPIWLEECRKEIAEKWNPQNITIKTILEMDVLDRVLKESMRLYPPVWGLTRRAKKEDEIMGVKIPKGSFVFFSMYALHRHPKYWENPTTFDPNRFTKDNIAKMKTKTNHWNCLYMPFLAGQRKCIGDQFAIMESKMILARLLPLFDFTLTSQSEVIPEPTVTLRPKGGLFLNIQPTTKK